MYKYFTNTLQIGKKVTYAPKCHSTNDIALTLAKQQAIEGHVVITSHQTGGRGQTGSIWEAQPDENITLSVILRPNFLLVKDFFWLHLVSSLAVCKMLEEVTNRPFKVKWPNDVYHEQKKVAGILTENALRGNRFEYVVVGIGINVNQAAFSFPKATSVYNITGKSYDLTPLIEALLIRLEQFYWQLKAGKQQPLKQLYYQNLYGYQDQILLEDCRVLPSERFYGEILGIGPEGKLAVKRADKMDYFNFKEIVFVLPDLSEG